MTTFHMWRDPSFLSSNPYRVEVRPLENVTCAASSEHGTWVLQTPGRLEFQTADKSMRIECRKEGYRDSVVELGCLMPPATPGEGASRGAAAGAILSLPATVGPAIFYGPGLVLAVIAGAAALGSIVGVASVKPEGTACSLANVKAGELQVYLEPVR